MKENPYLLEGGIAMEITYQSIDETNHDELAQILAELDRRSNSEYETDKVAYAKTMEFIKKIGNKLDSEGGEDLMRQVLTMAGSLGCNTRFIEREWNGIGSWWG
jgi:hypothetical protein